MLKRTLSLFLFIVLIFTSLSGAFEVSAAYNNTYTNTGNGQTDIYEVAKTQVGYYEGMEKYASYTKYGDWYHDYMNVEDAFITAPWCAMFVSWCSYQAGTIDVTGSYAYCPYWVSYFKNAGKWHNRDSGYIPIKGDIIFYADDGSLSSHVGIVYESNRSKVYTIEGNTEDSCKYRSYYLDDTYILGYGTPAYKGEVNTVVPELPTPVTGETVYITGYNAQMSWGTANLFTKDFTGSNTVAYNELGIAWSAYLVAEPTASENVYRITRVGEHLQSGNLIIPEGGIIFASHCDDRDTNSDAYTNSRDNKIATTGFKTGDCVLLTGVNFTTGAVSATATLTKTTLSDTDELSLVLNSEYTIDSTNGYLIGVKEGVSLNEMKSQFTNNGLLFNTANVGTGTVISITDGNGNTTDSLIIIIAGDVSGDGKINSGDYLKVKRAFLGSIVLTDVQLKAGCLSGGNSITSSDYLKIKRHFLGTFDIFGE